MARRMLALLTALLLVASLPLAAFAYDWDLNNGDITVSANESGQTVSQGETKDKLDPTPTIKGGNGSQSITVSTTGDNQANLTIENVNAKTIEVGSSNATITVSRENNKVTNGSGAGIHVSSGHLTITGDGKLEAKTNNTNSAAIGSVKGEEMSGSITIEGDAEVTATSSSFGAGIGSGNDGDMTGSITIEDNAQVKAVAGPGKNHIGGSGAGIGSGLKGDMTGAITIDDTAGVAATAYGGENGGADIGSGGQGAMSGSISISNKATVDAESIGAGGLGQETGTIRYFEPKLEPTQPEPTKTPLYRVLNERGEPLSCTKELADGVLTITVDADFAKLIGTVLSLKTLENQGVTTIVLVTKSATSTFTLADLQAKGSGTYTLTHDGETVTFTLAKADVSDILK